jgi:hypothetical protein
MQEMAVFHNGKEVNGESPESRETAGFGLISI